MTVVMKPCSQPSHIKKGLVDFCNEFLFQSSPLQPHNLLSLFPGCALLQREVSRALKLHSSLQCRAENWELLLRPRGCAEKLAALV